MNFKTYLNGIAFGLGLAFWVVVIDRVMSTV